MFASTKQKLGHILEYNDFKNFPLMMNYSSHFSSMVYGFSIHTQE